MQDCSTGFAPQRVCRPEKKRMWKRNESTPCKSPPTDYKLCCRQSSRVRRGVGLFWFLKDNKPTRIQMAGIQTDEITPRKCHHLLTFKEGEFRANWALDGSNSNSQTRHVSNSTINSWSKRLWLCEHNFVLIFCAKLRKASLVRFQKCGFYSLRT